MRYSFKTKDQIVMQLINTCVLLKEILMSMEGLAQIFTSCQTGQKVTIAIRET
jgi:hypothetical protein